MPDHPDHEQLAAHEAGDGDRRQRARVDAHLAGCPACAEVVAAAARARHRLAVLQEPELPAGLHERLLAATDRELARVPVERPAWWRRPAAWGAAAAALLLVVALLPLLHLGGGHSTAGSQGVAASRAPAPSGGGLAVVTLPGEFSPARLRQLLAADAAARQAFQTAGRVAVPAAPERTAPARGASPGLGAQGGTTTPATGRALGAERSAASGQAAGGLRAACTAAASRAAGRPLRAAFLLQTSFQGRPATLLVVAAGAQAEVYAFPRDDCSAAPLAVQQVPVP